MAIVNEREREREEEEEEEVRYYFAHNRTKTLHCDNNFTVFDNLQEEWIRPFVQLAKSKREAKVTKQTVQLFFSSKLHSTGYEKTTTTIIMAKTTTKP